MGLSKRWQRMGGELRGARKCARRCLIIEELEWSQFRDHVIAASLKRRLRR